MTTQPKRAAIAFIFVTVMLDMLALGLIVPILPKLILEFVGGDTALSAQLLGLFNTVWAAMQFVFSPVIGALSDRFGRRRVILASNFGLGFDYMVMALAPTWQWLFVGRIVSGITSASIPAAFAYISDVTPPEKRSAAFGLVSAAFGVGFVVGPAVGGVLGQIDPRLPFWVASGLSLANALYGIFVLPESLAKDKRAPFSWANANPIGSLVLLKSRKGLFGIAMVNFLGYVGHVVLPSTYVLYAMYRYQWSERTVGLALALVGVGSMVVQGGLVGPIVKRFGERNTLFLGLVAGVAGFALMGVAPTGAIFMSTIALLSIWGLSGAAAMSLMTARVGPTEQGQLQGANNSMRAISELIGPSIFTLSFAWAIKPGAPPSLPGLPFLISAGMLVAAIAVALVVTAPPSGPAVQASPEI